MTDPSTNGLKIKIISHLFILETCFTAFPVKEYKSKIFTSINRTLFCFGQSQTKSFALRGYLFREEPTLAIGRDANSKGPLEF